MVTNTVGNKIPVANQSYKIVAQFSNLEDPSCIITKTIEFNNVINEKDAIAQLKELKVNDNQCGKANSQVFKLHEIISIDSV